MWKRTALSLLLLLCLSAETGALFWWRPALGLYAAPVVYVAGAVLGIVAALGLLRQKTNSRATFSKGRSFLPMLFFCGVAGAGWLYLRKFFPQFPVDPAQSDIIPLIQSMTGRFRSGTAVYAPLDDFGYTMYPNYLPLTWGPFLVADWLRLDYRTLAYGLFSGAVILFAALLPVRRRWKPVLFLGPFLAWGLFLRYVPQALCQTVEPMIAGYYLLLVLAIYLRHTALLAAALVCCLLSRYAVVLFLPAALLIWIVFGNKKQAFRVSLLTLGGITLLFVLPFLLRDFSILERAYAYYTAGALEEWKGQSWQERGALPYQLSQGYGFAIYFYRFWGGALAQKLAALQKVHLVVCLAMPALAAAWYWLWGRRWLPLHWFLLLALKLYLVLFFALIQVPYSYLFLTPLVVSFALAALLLLRPVLENEAAGERI